MILLNLHLNHYQGEMYLFYHLNEMQDTMQFLYYAMYDDQEIVFVKQRKL